MKKRKLRSTKLPRIFSVVSIALFLTLLIAFLADRLGNSPIRAAQLWTGRIAFAFLLASLSITPLRTITGNAMIIPLRKTFGLNSFYWAFLHFLVFAGVNFRFDIEAITEAILFRKFIIPGAIALLILAILAITTADPVKKAVARIWRKIHIWVYPAAVLVLLHFSGANASSGAIKPLPLIAGVYLLVLFVLRLKPVRMAVIHRRQELL